MPKVKASSKPAPEDEGVLVLPEVEQLKEIDDRYLALEKEYEREVQKLQNEYTKKQQPFLEERKKILTAPAEGGPATGTPALSSFWLKAMQNHPAFEDNIHEWDEPVLEFLSDIEKADIDNTDHTKGFKLTFHFLENPYFENIKLTKEYITDESNPYCGEEEVKEIKCSTIDWKAGKNVTVERVAKKVKGGGAKKQKQKGKEKEEPRESFFRDFFRSMHAEMELPEDARQEDIDDEELEDYVRYLMANDHEIGVALQHHIIPFAIRWYTGEAAPDYERMGDDEDSEEEEDSDDESSEEPPPRKGGKAGGPKAAAKKGKAKASPSASPGTKPADGKQAEECKQQ